MDTDVRFVLASALAIEKSLAIFIEKSDKNFKDQIYVFPVVNPFNGKK